MRIFAERITPMKTVYQANDGNLFSDEEQAQAQDKALSLRVFGAKYREVCAYDSVRQALQKHNLFEFGVWLVQPNKARGQASDPATVLQFEGRLIDVLMHLAKRDLFTYGGGFNKSWAQPVDPYDDTGLFR
jgi:hypothetical protein